MGDCLLPFSRMRLKQVRLAGRSIVPNSDLAVLTALLLAGALLRLGTMLAIRPITYGLNDSGTYLAAAAGPEKFLFYDVHHAVGYSVYLNFVGPVVQNGVN